MKYLSILFLLSFFSYSAMAQSTVKGVLLKDFETFENHPNYATATKKWHLAELPVFNQDDCNRSGIVDLCFLIDATSSMDDQIGFLKAEIKNTIETVQDFNAVRFRTSAVFYRDSEEEYKVKAAPFTNELDKTIQFISSQNSAGGGDYQEAFADGFEKAVNQDWQKEADAKLLFIFCDAPPHDDPESISLLEKALQTAAAKGITLFPIIGTSADFNTEVIMRSLARQSEGALISLQQERVSTNSHADFLTDLIKDLMITYTDLADCTPSPTTLEKGFVYGHVSDALSNDPLISTNIFATKNGNFISGAVADLDGFYSLEIEPGIYDITFSFLGFKTEVKKDIEINPEHELELSAQLKGGIDLETVVVSGYHIPLGEVCILGCRMTTSHNCFQSIVAEEKTEDAEIVPTIATFLFPNPASSMVTVAAAEEFSEVKILSADGKLIFQEKNIHQNKLEIQVGDWVAGIYFVYYFFEGRTAVEKLVVNPYAAQKINVNY